MREQISVLTQSRFFSPVFNGAIFDGPIRIYFSQSQEAAAMKLYFAVLARMRSLFGTAKDNFNPQSPNIFILIYPSAESFNIVFPSDTRTKLQVDTLEQDYIIGTSGPIDENEFPKLFESLDGILKLLPQDAAVSGSPSL